MMIRVSAYSACALIQLSLSLIYKRITRTNIITKLLCKVSVMLTQYKYMRAYTIHTYELTVAKMHCFKIALKS